MSDDATTPYPMLPPPPPAAPLPTPIHTGPALTTAWLAVGSLAAVVGLLFGTLQVVGLLAHEEHDETVRIDDPAVAVLDVVSEGGTIEIVGGDVDVVHIDARVSDGLIGTNFTQEVVGDRLQVRVKCAGVLVNTWCAATLRIAVPRDIEVKVRANHDGVTLRGLTGRVDAESSDGSVEAEALSGATRLHSENGGVRASRLRTDSIQTDSANGSVRLEFAAAPLSAIAHSDNGSVEIAVPRGDEGYAVDINSDNGSTDNLVKADPDSERRIVVSSSNGSVTVRYLD